VRVLITDRNPLTAMGIASHFQEWDRAAEIAVMTGEDWHPNAYSRRSTSDNSVDTWFPGGGIKMFDEPKEVLQFQPELLINTDPSLGYIMVKIVDKLHKPFHFGCTNMSTILTKESKMCLNLIRQAGLDVVEHNAFDSSQKLVEWAALQDEPKEDLIVEVDNHKEFFLPVTSPINFLDSIMMVSKQGTQFVVRKYSQAICEFGVVFSGNGFVGRPFMVKEVDSCLHILHFGDQSEDFTNRILNKLSNVLEAIGFRGCLFLSFDVLSQKITRITSRTPDNFWLTFLAGLNQSAAKYLFSLSKGVKFQPEVKRAVYGYNYKVDVDAQVAFDGCEWEEDRDLTRVKQYWGGVGEQTFYIRWQSGFPVAEPVGLLCSSQASEGFIAHSCIPSSLRMMPPFIVPNLPLLVGLFSYNQPPSPELPDPVECQVESDPEPVVPVEELEQQEEEVITNGV